MCPCRQVQNTQTFPTINIDVYFWQKADIVNVNFIVLQVIHTLVFDYVKVFVVEHRTGINSYSVYTHTNILSLACRCDNGCTRL